MWKQGGGGGWKLNGHSALFSLGGPSKDKEAGQTKTQLVHFRSFFSCLFVMFSNKAVLKYRNIPPKKLHQCMAGYCQEEKNLFLFLQQANSIRQTKSSVSSFRT